jgi:hypothetical protein
MCVNFLRLMQRKYNNLDTLFEVLGTYERILALYYGLSLRTNVIPIVIILITVIIINFQDVGLRAVPAQLSFHLFPSLPVSLLPTDL